MRLSDQRLIEQDVQLGWNKLDGMNTPLGLHLVPEVDGTLGGRLTAGVAGTGHGGMVGIMWFRLDFSPQGATSVACWPVRPLIAPLGPTVTLWGDGKVHCIPPNGRVAWRMLLNHESPDDVRAALLTRPRKSRQVRLTPTLGVTKPDMVTSTAAAVLTRMETAVRNGAADPGVQLDHAAVGISHGLGRLQPNEGGGVLLDFTPGTGYCPLDLMRSDRVGDRHQFDYLDAATGEPLLTPLQVDPYYAMVAGTNKTVTLPEFWESYFGSGDNRKPRTFTPVDGCTYTDIACGTASSGDTLRGFDLQHGRRKWGEQEPACEQWDDKLSQLDRACTIGQVALMFTDVFIASLKAQVDLHPHQGHGFIGRREVGWAKDALNCDVRTRGRAAKLSAITQNALMENAQVMRAEPALVGDPNVTNFNPSPYPPAGTLPRTECAAQIMEAIINAYSEARLGNVRLAQVIVRRLFVDERRMIFWLRKSYMTLHGGIKKFVAVAPAEHPGSSAYTDPPFTSGGQDYFAWTALALGLYLDASYTSQYRACAQKLGRPTPTPPSTSFADAAARLQSDIGHEQTGLFLIWAAAHP